MSATLNRDEERVLALGGLLQACYLVTGIARTGMIGEDSLAGSLESIFVTNPDVTLDVYRTGNGVRTGLRLVHEVVGDMQFGNHGESIHYALAVLSLERRLAANPEVLRRIGAGIESISEHKSLNNLYVTSEDVIERLSRLYEQTAGTLEPRIRILGVQKHLQNDTNTCRIRALLLSALRSAVLWRQLGGSKLQWVLGRGKLLRALDHASEIVNNIH